MNKSKSIMAFNFIRNLFAIGFVILCFAAFVKSENPEPLAPQEEAASGGRNISSADAKVLINNYIRWNPGKKQKGGYISKSVFDQLWARNATAKGVFWYMGSEIVNERDTVIRLVVESGNTAATIIDGGSGIYKSQSMCPTDCGTLAQ
ncbi:MAG: hypothetical protein IPO27_18430 [Bacteroidetes bacterium]|nr:hypothetical protein [Bacteroidota bacterium]